MDGTLLDSMRYWRLGCMEYLLAHQLPVPDAILPVLFQKSTVKLIGEALDQMGISYDREEIWHEVSARMRGHYLSDVLPKADAREYLEKLRSRGVRLCVATASPRDYACMALARHGLHGLFEFIADETDVGTSKKDPVFFEAIARRLALPIEDCLLYEDALYSIKSAKDIGMRVCAIEDSSARNNREEILQISDIYATGYRELLDRGIV